jgi:predicted nucleic acid-binding protein
MSRFQQIIEQWPSRRDLAEDVGVNLYAVHHWHHRNRIPANYDAALIEAASRRGIALGFEDLALARAHRANSEVNTL